VVHGQERRPFSWSSKDPPQSEAAVVAPERLVPSIASSANLTHNYRTGLAGGGTVRFPRTVPRRRTC
jgi:hypothetical protein